MICPTCKGFKRLETGMREGRMWFTDCPDCHATGTIPDAPKAEPTCTCAISGTENCAYHHYGDHPQAGETASTEGIANLEKHLAFRYEIIDKLKQQLAAKDEENARLRDALDVFARVYRINAPIGASLGDDTPNEQFCPKAWPTWGDFKRANAALTPAESACPSDEVRL